MKSAQFCLAAALACCTPAAFAQSNVESKTPTASITLLPPGFLITDLSIGGEAACGNVQGDGSYETFRWTAADGVVRLGAASVPAIGVGGGTPDISYNGRRVSAGILSSNSLETIGIWDIVNGWTEAMPPMQPDGRIMDQSLGSAWGLSGDGNNVTGFYWNTLGDAQGCSWSIVTHEMTTTTQTVGRSVRINASNFDASVLGGWEERYDGPWCPTVWRNGTKMILDSYGIPTQVYTVDGSGNVVAGDSVDPAQATRSATIWRWNGSSYVAQRCGWLKGTQLTSGGAAFEAIADNGTIGVGTNMYTWYPGAAVDGFVWTPKGGMVKDTTFITSLGLTAPQMDIRSLNAISPDGTAIAGYGLRFDGSYQSFIIKLPRIGGLSANDRR